MFNPGGGGLPSSRQMGMCHWMGLHFHNWILTILGLHFYKSFQNAVAHFQDFGGQKIQVCRDLKIERFTPH